MVCWWGLRLKLIRTRVGRPLLFCKQFPVKYPLFSPFSASQFVWRNPIFSFKFKIWNPIFLITLPSGKFDQLNVLWFSSIKKPRGSVSWVSCLIRTPVFAFSGFRCVLYLLSFCWCFTFESQFYAFARCAVDRNQIHKIWIIPQFSWCKCRSVVSFCNCTFLAPGTNSFDEQNSAKRHHLSLGSPVSWSPSPPPP